MYILRKQSGNDVMLGIIITIVYTYIIQRQEK